MTRRDTTSRIARGFTVVETMVTIGILVIVAAGAATIFNTIGDTIDDGRRVAKLNRFAARLERVMREDFESMTRDGFMVIVNQNAPGRDPDGNDRNVQLAPVDTTDPDDDGRLGRPRRADEIMFFARGDFETARRAVSPEMVARSDEAAIYYGHGQKRRPDLTNDPDDGLTDPLLADNLFFNPKVTDTNIDENARLGVEASDGIPNPNRYASDWTLLRHVTLLVDPQSAGQELPREAFGVVRTGSDRAWLEDSDRQVALQPAARSIFTSLGHSDATEVPEISTIPEWFREYDTTATNAPPIFRASGLVDIATHNLEDIKTVLTALSADRVPTDYWEDPDEPYVPNDPGVVGHERFAQEFWEESGSPGPAGATEFSNNDDGVDNSDVNRMRRWMIDALPSIWDTETPTQLSRVRYEDVPPRTLFGEDAFDETDDGERHQAYAIADQEMLGTSVFLPRCTEFIVEWSYGFTNPLITDPTNPRYKRLIWYGLDRWVDANGDGIIDRSANPVEPEIGEDHRVAQGYVFRPTAGLSEITRGPSPKLIVGRNPIIGGGAPNDPEIAAFGYPDSQGNDWPWPEFIRVTISIADPTDPTIEETFRMVFEIPDASDD